MMFYFLLGFKNNLQYGEETMTTKNGESDWLRNCPGNLCWPACLSAKSLDVSAISELPLFINKSQLCYPIG